MPRAVRNFWIEAEIDSREKKLEGGPRGLDGGFNMTIYVREHNSVSRAIEIRGMAYPSGRLMLHVFGYPSEYPVDSVPVKFDLEYVK